jgi:hypothetical protein
MIFYMGSNGSNNEHQRHKSPGISKSDGAREYLHNNNVHRGRLFLKNRLEPMSTPLPGERRPEAMPFGIRSVAASVRLVMGRLVLNVGSQSFGSD